MSASRRVTLPALAVAVAALAGAACSPGSQGASRLVEDRLEPTATSAVPAASAPACSAEQQADFDAMMALGGFASLAPGEVPAPGAMPDGTFMHDVQARGRLIVGVDQNTLQFGYRNPITSELSGLDIELLREIARAIFGRDGDIDERIQFTALSTAERVPAVADREVDVVASLITVTCERARDVAFSTEYYRANQNVMVREDSSIRSASDLTGKTVCATVGSTSLTNLEEQVPDAVPYPVEARTDCLVALQQGTVDAITADDTILVSFRAQDPKTRILDLDLSDEPYAIAINAAHPEFVRFTNGVLEALRSNGRLSELYLSLERVNGEPTGFVPPPPPEPRYVDR